MCVCVCVQHSNKNVLHCQKIHCEHFSHEFPRADAFSLLRKILLNIVRLEWRMKKKRAGYERVQIKHRNSENPNWTWLSIQQNEWMCVCCISKYISLLSFVLFPSNTLAHSHSLDRLFAATVCHSSCRIKGKTQTQCARIIKLHKWKIEMS